MSAEKMMLSESSYCPGCNSFFHAPDTCPKRLPRYQPVSNVLVGHAAHTGATDPQTEVLPASHADLALELHLRSILAGGIGHEGRRCDKHHSMQRQILGKAPSGRHARAPIVLDDFDDTGFVTRPFLPICSTCVHTETGLEATKLSSGLDMCRCATMLARARCPNCVLAEIHGALKYEVLKRTKQSKDGASKIACRCGKAITAEETARQCAYCRGIATAPFHGYDGQVLEFRCGAESPVLSDEEGSTDEKAQ